VTICALKNRALLSGSLLIWSLCVLPLEGGQIISYDVSFKGSAIATQTVVISEYDQAMEIGSSFAADLMVFVAHHHVEEKCRVRFDRESGDVQSFESRVVDGMSWRETRGTMLDGGALEIVRTDRDGTSTGLVARAGYDIHSLSLYVVDPAAIPSSNQVVRVLDIGKGQVLNYGLQAISESRTRDRQHIPVTHLVWTLGQDVSHSWHPKDLVVWPDPIIRRNEVGEFEFRLSR